VGNDFLQFETSRHSLVCLSQAMAVAALMVHVSAKLDGKAVRVIYSVVMMSIIVLVMVIASL
jgi:hypothetical protein